MDTALRRCHRSGGARVAQQPNQLSFQKIQVHAFICLLGLLLARVIEREARKLERREGLSALLDSLADIRLAMVLEPSGKKVGRPRASWQLEIADKETAEFFKALVPNKQPFVYTDGSQ